MRKNKKEVKDEIKEDAIEEVEEKDLEQNSSDEVEKKLNSEIEELKNQICFLRDLGIFDIYSYDSIMNNFRTLETDLYSRIYK